MSNRKGTIVLIHGLWVTAKSWENWVPRYTAAGYRVIAKSWPGMDTDIEELRRNPERVASIGIDEVVRHYEKIIEEIDEPPIIMGHSFGGLIAQILLDRGYGAVGVAIAPAPVKGIIFLPFSTLRVTFPALRNPANNHRAVPLTPEQFHYAFTNNLSAEESLRVYETYAVPGPEHVLFQAAFANFRPNATTTVDFANRNRAPLLLVAGENDHVSPPAVVQANYKLYLNSGTLADYKEFPGRTHFVLGQQGWEEVADFAINWAEAHRMRTASAAH